MQDAEWADWTNRHLTVFGMRDEVDAKMLDSWRRLFDSAGYTWMELMEATDWLAINAAPKFRTEHLPALNNRILAWRAVQYRREIANPELDLGTCSVCHGVGFVTVPHPMGVKNGEWVPICTTRSERPVFYTVAVLCDCALGRWKGQRRKVDDDHPPMMNMAQYEAKNPDWRGQMLARERNLAEQWALEPYPTPDRHDGSRRSLEGIVASVAKGWKMPAPTWDRRSAKQVIEDEAKKRRTLDKAARAASA